MPNLLNNASYLLALGVCALLLLANAMTYPINHDEQQYVAAAFMSMDNTLYKDFIYLQTPYFPLLVSFFYSLLDTEHYFLSARVINFGFSILTVVATSLIILRVTRDKVMAAGAAFMLTSSSVMLFSFGVARNDILPCLFQMVGLLFFLESFRTARYAPWCLAVAGFSAALAVGTKISYVFFPAGMVIWLCVYDWRRRSFLSIWLALGGLLGAIPMIYYATIAPEGFLYGNLGYHSTAPFEWYTSRGLAHRLTFSDQLVQFWRLFLYSPVTLGVFALAGLIAMWHIPGGRFRSLSSRVGEGGESVVILLCLLAIPMCILPKPTWVQYFVPVIPLMIVLIAMLVSASDSVIKTKARLLFLITAFGTALPGLMGMGKLIPDLFDRSTWADREIRVIVDNLIELQHASGKPLQVATLSPMHVLDAKVRIYPELVSGPFYYRTSHLQTDDFTRTLGGVSRNMLGDFLEHSPPDVILIGYEQDQRINLDDDFRAYATAHGYHERTLGHTNATLFIKPGLVN